MEKWGRTKAAAIAIKRQVESDELAGLLIDPRAGAQPLSDYAEEWLATRPSRVTAGRLNGGLRSGLFGLPAAQVLDEKGDSG